MAISWGILIDLDETLVRTKAVEAWRRQRAWDKVYANFNKTFLPPGTHLFLQKVAVYGAVGVVTSSPRSYAEKLLRHHHCPLPVLTAYHDVVRRKPAPDPILHAAARLNVPPQRCMVLGDRIDDMLAAEAAHSHGIGICWESEIPDDRWSWCSSWADVLSKIVAITDKDV